ncbi:hypothetical protein WA026_005346 [Henosepilachna vigintioctopunctata]|uniref:Uncharacterized protein n=1 Tax=Henosepilachna vigintioctopunctata TaxID=420089 RepID=A0AAW1UWR2_9CUCU
MFSSSKTSPSIDKVTRIFENKQNITEKRSQSKGSPGYPDWMSVPSDLLALYEDDVGNMAFNDCLLQEITQVTSQLHIENYQ